MVNLQIKRTIKLPVDKSRLIQAAQATLEAGVGTTDCEITVLIGDDALLKRLNWKYRKINETTDVLSFPSNEPDPDTKSLYLGDIAISLPRAEEQAALAGHPVADELQLLVVHGTLHLMGHDHLEEGEKKRMQAFQNQLLSQLGVKLENAL